MSGDTEVQRLSELREVNRRLGRYEKEISGIAMEDATAIAKERFSKDTLIDILNSLELACVSLKPNEDNTIDADALSVALCAPIAIISKLYKDPVYTYLFLWGKYQSNAMKFSGLAIHEKNLSSDEYMLELKASKSSASKAGWNDLQCLRIIFDYFCNDGWYYFPDEEMFPRPIGSDDLNIYQLVTRQFILSFPRNIRHKDLYDLLLEEVKELRDEVNEEKRDEFKIGFEAVDVFIYLTHIASEFNLSISDLILMMKNGRY